MPKDRMFVHSRRGPAAPDALLLRLREPGLHLRRPRATAPPMRRRGIAFCLRSLSGKWCVYTSVFFQIFGFGFPNTAKTLDFEYRMRSFMRTKKKRQKEVILAKKNDGQMKFWYYTILFVKKRRMDYFSLLTRAETQNPNSNIRNFQNQVFGVEYSVFRILAITVWEMVCLKFKLWFFNSQLGFEAAVAAIGMKAKVSEAEHPLLCEGTRSVPNQTISDNFFVCCEAQTMELSNCCCFCCGWWWWWCCCWDDFRFRFFFKMETFL